MRWLDALRDHAESGRRRFDERMSEIKDLPRGHFLRQKYELMDESAVGVYKSTSPPASPAIIDEIGPLPAELRALLEWSDGLSDKAVFRPALEIELFGTDGIRQFQGVTREVVELDELFPPVFKKLLIFGKDRSHRLLALWQDESLETSPVLLIDMEYREILLVSYSLDLFFSRMVFAIDHGVQFKIGSRVKKLLTHIAESEPGPTYPPKVKGQTQFLFDKVNGFPESWQPLLSEKDRSFQLS